MKVTLMPGIESISGSMKERNGKKIVFKTFRKPSLSRESGKSETRAYIMNSYQRSTPVTAGEMERRRTFAQCAKRVQSIMATNPQMSRKEAWKIAQSEISGEQEQACTGNNQVTTR